MNVYNTDPRWWFDRCSLDDIEPMNKKSVPIMVDWKSHFKFGKGQLQISALINECDYHFKLTS